MTNTMDITHYAVELPGRGFFGFVESLVPDTDVDFFGLDSIEAATRTLDNVRARYRALGMEEVGLTARIVSRTLTYTASDWTPVAITTEEVTS